MDRDGLVESLKFAAEQAEAAQSLEPTVVTVPGSPSDRVFLWMPHEKKLTAQCMARPRVYEAMSVAGFVSALNYLKGRVPKDAGPVAVFVGRTGVTAMLGEERRRERLHMYLRHTNAYAGLRNSAGKEVEQQEMLTALRVHFRSDVAPAGFMAKLGQIKWVNDDRGTAEAGAGRQSVSQSVVRELAGIDGSFPDQIVLKCNVFVEAMACKDVPMWAMQVAVNANPSTRKFSLTPIEGELQSAEDSELAAIAKVIRDGVEGVEVIEGAQWAGAPLPT